MDLLFVFAKLINTRRPETYLIELGVDLDPVAEEHGLDGVIMATNIMKSIIKQVTGYDAELVNEIVYARATKGVRTPDQVLAHIIDTYEARMEDAGFSYCVIAEKN